MSMSLQSSQNVDETIGLGKSTQLIPEFVDENPFKMKEDESIPKWLDQPIQNLRSGIVEQIQAFQNN